MVGADCVVIGTLVVVSVYVLSLALVPICSGCWRRCSVSAIVVLIYVAVK